MVCFKHSVLVRSIENSFMLKIIYNLKVRVKVAWLKMLLFANVYCVTLSVKERQSDSIKEDCSCRIRYENLG